MSVSAGNIPMSKRLEQDFSVSAVITPNTAMTGLPASGIVRQFRATSTIKIMTPNIAVTPGGVIAAYFEFVAGILVPFHTSVLRTESRYFQQGTTALEMLVTIKPDGFIRFTPVAALVAGTSYIFPSQLFEWPAESILTVCQ